MYSAYVKLEIQTKQLDHICLPVVDNIPVAPAVCTVAVFALLLYDVR